MSAPKYHTQFFLLLVYFYIYKCLHNTEAACIFQISLLIVSRCSGSSKMEVNEYCVLAIDAHAPFLTMLTLLQLTDTHSMPFSGTLRKAHSSG